MALNLESLQGRAGAGELAWVVNAFPFSTLGRSPVPRSSRFLPQGQVPSEAASRLPLAGPLAGQGRAGPGRARVARGAAGQPWRAAAAPPLAGCGRGVGGGG